MKIKKVWAMYFSATGTTKKTVTAIADTISQKLGAKRRDLDFTLPAGREKKAVFASDELVVFGTPVIAGRIPNVLLEFLNTMQGNDALAVAIVVFGNRAYDDALIEARDLLENKGCHTVAAGAFVGEHSFSTTLGAGRPDAMDMAVAKHFAQRVAEKIKALQSRQNLLPVPVKGTPFPYSGYYQPRDLKGNIVDLRKVKPRTNKELCIECNICARVCPMGSVDWEDISRYTGICIKCGACIKKCPTNARYYDDPAYIYHKEELEEEFARRAEPELFFYSDKT